MTEIFKINKLVQIQLNNFKSFDQEVHYVGPFIDFTCIVGPNGGGKSNIIDAICFVYGIFQNQSRITTVLDFINKKYGERDNSKKCRVTLTLECSGSQRYLELSREISQNSDNFYINKNQVSRQEYENFLFTHHIINQTNTFLLLQGETDQLATMKPDNMTEYFEKISGSLRYKDEYESTKKNIDELNKDIEKNVSKLNTLKGDKRKLKQMKQNNEEFKKLSENLDNLELKIQLLEFLQIDVSNKQLTEDLNKKIQSEKDHTEAKENIKHIMQQLDKELSNLLKQEKEIRKNQKNYKDNYIENKQNLQEMDQKQRILDANLKTYENTYIQIKKKLESVNQDDDQFQKERQKYILLLDEKTKELTKLGKVSNLSTQAQNDYNLLAQQSINENYEITSDIKKLKDENDYIEQQLQIIQSELDNNSNSQKRLNNKLQELSQKIFQLEVQQNNTLDTKQINEKILNLQKQIDQKEKRNEELLKKKQEKENLTQKFELQLQEYIEDTENDQIILEIKKGVKGFKGALWSLFQMRDSKNQGMQKKYELVVKQALGSVLNYLVVQSDQDAKLCKQILKSRSIQKDLIILQNFPVVDETIINDQRNALEKYNKGITNSNEKCRLVYDLINIYDDDQKIDNCLMYFLKGKICCKDYDKATILRTDKSFKQIITINDNNIVNSQSGLIMSYGDMTRYENYRIGSNIQKQKLQEKIEAEIFKIKNEMEKISKEIEQSSDNQLEIDLQDQQNQLKFVHEKLNKNKQEITQLQEEEKTTQNNQKQLEIESIEIQGRLQKTQQQMEKSLKEQKDKQKMLNDFEKNIFRDFQIKYQIKDLSQIRDQDIDIIQQRYREIAQIKNNIKKIETLIQEGDNQTYMKEKSRFEQLIQKNMDEQQNLKIQQEELKKVVETANEELSKLKKQLEENEQQATSNKQKQKTEFNKINAYKINNIVFEREKNNLKNQIQSNIMKKNNLLEQAQINDIKIVTKEINESQEEQEVHEFEDNSFYSSLISSLTQNSHLEGFVDTKMIQKMQIEYRQINDIIQEINENQSDVQTILSNYRSKWAKEVEDTRNRFEEFSSKAVQEGLIGKEDDYTSTEERIKELVTYLEDKTNQRTAGEQKLEELSQKRTDLFMSLFRPVSQSIDEVYKKLTQVGELRGSAFMYLENSQHPFLGGLIYSPTPARKTFVFDTEGQLSGGEKTMATLSLFFAINKVLKTPFLVFDEADAFLDQNNTKKYLEIIKKFSTEEKIQCIVITHKKEIFENSQNLVGITYNPRKQTSITLSLDLRNN